MSNHEVDETLPEWIAAVAGGVILLVYAWWLAWRRDAEI